MAAAALDAARKALPAGSPLSLRALDDDLIDLQIDGVLRALVEMSAGDDGEAAVPVRLAVCAHDDAMPLGASQPASSHVFADISARGQRLLARLEALPAAERLPVLSRWLSSYHDLFTAPCAHCGRHLPAVAGAAPLLPPTVRTSSGAAYSAQCFAACSLDDVEEGWLDAAASG